MVEDEVYVMLMMMRADEGYTPNEKCSLEEMVACALAEDTDACLAACTGNEGEEEDITWNGSLTISKVSAAATQEVAKNAVKKNVWTIKLTAGDEGAVVSSIIVKRSGLGNNKVSVQLQYGDYTTTARAMWSNWEATVKFSPALELKPNQSAKVDVLVNFLEGTEWWENHTFSVIWANLNGTAKWSAELWTLKTTSYSVSEATVSFNGLTPSLKAWEKEKTLTKVAITAWDKNVVINGFSLSKMKWTPSPEDFDKVFWDIKAYYNNKEVGKVAFTKDSITVSNLNIEKDAWTTATIELRATSIYIWNTAHTYINFGNEADIDMYEADTKEAMQLAATPAVDVDVTFTEVKLNLTKLSEWNETVAPGTDIVLFDGEISSTAEFDVIWYQVVTDNIEWLATLNDRITLSISNAGSTVIESQDMEGLSTPADAVCSDTTYTTKAKCLQAGEVWTYAQDAAGWAATFDEDDSFTVSPNNKVRVRITAHVSEDVSLATDFDHTFTFVVTDLRDTETDTDLTLAPAKSLDGDLITIAAWSLDLDSATVAAPAGRNIWPNGTNLEVARFALKASAENITVNDMVFTQTETITDNLSSIVSSAKLLNAETDEVLATDWEIDDTNSTITFEWIDLLVEKDEDLNVKLVVNTKAFTVVNESVTFDTDVTSANTEREVIAASDLPSTLAWAITYNFSIKSPTITITKKNRWVFEVTIKNEDTSNAITLDKITAAVKSNDDSFEWYFGSREQWSTDTTSLTALVSDSAGPAVLANAVNGRQIAKNKSYTFEIAVTSTYNLTTGLTLTISQLDWTLPVAWNETYNVTTEDLTE